MSRLVLLGEGKGDARAFPNLVNRLLLELAPEHAGLVFVDSNIIRTGGIEGLSGRRSSDWDRYLRLAFTSRKKLSAILAVFDGDTRSFEGAPFCPARAASELANRARRAGAGAIFSLAVVFLCREYESVLVAAAHQLPGIPLDTEIPLNPEMAPRDAKGWLDERLPDGYDPVGHQLALTQAHRLGTYPRTNEIIPPT